MSCKSHIYADDGQLHLSFDPERAVHTIDEINSDLQSISKRSESNGLKHWQVHTLPTRTFIQ